MSDGKDAGSGDTPSKNSETGDHASDIMEREVEKAVKQSLRWPERIVLFFTCVAAVAAVINAFFVYRQFEEMRSEKMAYVYATGVKFGSVYKDGFDHLALDVSFPFTNSGQTPTRNFQWFWYVRCEDALMHLPTDKDPHCNWPIGQVSSSVGPGASVEEAITVFHERSIDYLKVGYRSEVAGWLAYDDLGGKHHRAFWCFTVKWSDPNNGDSGKPEYYGCATRHACSDEECRQQPALDSEMKAQFAFDRKTVPVAFRPL